jgi:hypothetical protein
VVDSETAQVTLSDSYKYDEKSALAKVNIGKFGYGRDIKIGSEFKNLKPTNYNYRSDPYDVRWKHIDEFTGNVNSAAVTTTDFKYYFYDEYYRYTADKKFQIDKETRDFQTGDECYSYIHTKSDIVQRGTKCDKFKQPFNVTQGQVTGMIAGIVLLGLFIFSMCFGALEITHIQRRNSRVDAHIALHKRR